MGPDGFVLGTSTTLHNSDTVNNLLSFNYPKNFGESISSITIKFKRSTNTADDTILGPGKEICVWWSNTLTDVTPIPDALPSNTFRLFRGYIIDKKLSGNVITITASDIFIKTMWTVGTSSTDINKDTTTAIKTLLTNLCTVAGLTASNNVATPTPTNIVTFYSDKQNIFERISYLLNLIGWYGFYDPTTEKTIIFQPKTAGATQVFNNSNIIKIPEWNNDSKDLFNEVTLTGGSNQKTVLETHTIDSGTMYVLNAGTVRPEAMVVTAESGTSPKEAWTADEYYVVSNGLIFTKGTEPTTNGNDLYIQFTYQTASSSTTIVNTDVPTSQSLYLTRQKALQKRDTLSSTDLTSMATNLVDNDFWGKPLQEVTITVNDSVLLPILGSQADVTDPMSGRIVTYAIHNTIVYSMEFQWPIIGIKTFISSRPLKNPMQQTTVQDGMEKIQLELQKINPTSLMRKDGSTSLDSSTGFWNVGGSQLLNLRFENSTVAPVNLGTGGIYFDTSAGAGKGVGKLNLGTAAVPSWASISIGEAGIYLPRTAGVGYPLTGDLFIKGTSPDLWFADASANLQLQVGWFSGEGSYINSINNDILLAKNASVKLTIGTSAITASVPLAMGTNQITSGVITGTAPFTVASTTVVSNLNADTVDGLHANQIGVVTSVFGRTGAVVAATNDYTWAQVDKTTSSIANITTKDHDLLTGLTDDDHTQYLLLTAGSGRKLTGDLYINKTTPSIALQEAGVFKGALQWSTNTVLMSYVGGVIVDAPTGSTVDLRVNNAPLLTIAGASITASVQMAVAGTVINGDAVEVNANGTGNRYAYIDFHGDDTYTDYGLRLIRSNVGANSDSSLTHKGTGNLNIQTEEAGGIVFITSGTYRMGIAAGGGINLNGNAITAAPSMQAPAASSLTLKVSAGQSIVFQAV